MKTVLGVFLLGVIFSYSSSGNAQDNLPTVVPSPSPEYSHEESLSFLYSEEKKLNPNTLNRRQFLEENRQEIESLESTGMLMAINPQEIENTELPTDPEVLKNLRKAAQALLMRESGNVLLVGAPGVGKSHSLNLVLAYLNEARIPEFQRRIYMRGEASAFAARKDGHAGDTEQKVQKLIDVAKIVPITILMDEIATIQGAGSHRNSSIDVMDRLKEVLASGQLKIIGATTDYEFELYFGSRPPLVQRFVKVEINSPDEATLVKILKKRYKEDAGREMTPEIINGILKISRVFGGASAEPRRSIKLLDYLTSSEKLDSTQYKTEAQVIEKASEFYNFNLQLFLDAEVNEKYVRQAEESSNKKLLGLGESIGEFYKALRFWTSKSERDKPLSVMIFGGKGLGKTVFSSSVAEHLGYKFLKIPMMDISGPELMSRISTQLEMYPFTIFLLDEPDKSKIGTQRSLLSVLDSATVTERKTSPTGEPGPVVSVSTKNAIFIFATNSGESLSSRGMSIDEIKEAIAKEEKIDTYLLDRVNKVIRFNTPDAVALKAIVRMRWEKVAKDFLAEAEARGVNADTLYDMILKRHLEKAELARPVFGFTRSQQDETRAVDELSKMSIRNVENIIESAAEEMLTRVRTEKAGVSSAGVPRCMGIFSKG